MLTVVTWKWRALGQYRSTFSPASVNALRRMVARHYARPHRFVCVTDDADGLDADVEIVPAWNDFADLRSPHGGANPSCYRRLRMFAQDIGDVLGSRFVSLDIDTVVVGDLAPLWDRPEDIVLWGELDQRSFYNGSMVLMTAGARPQVWERFDPARSPLEALRAGRFGSDQGWISHCLGRGEATWTTADGVYSYRVHVGPTGVIPPDARIVMFHGPVDPWTPEAQALPWVQEAYA